MSLDNAFFGIDVTQVFHCVWLRSIFQHRSVPCPVNIVTGSLGLEDALPQLCTDKYFVDVNCNFFEITGQSWK